MLVAAIKNKLRLNKVGLVEDEVTSTIFGPLLDMPVEDAWNIIKELSNASGISTKLLPHATANEFMAEFWPTHVYNTLAGHRILVIPDVVFRFSFPGGASCNVLLEVKWGASLNPRCELIRQWITRPDNTEKWIHMYLVTSAGKGKSERNDSIELLRKGCDYFSYDCCSRQQKKFETPKTSNKDAELWKDHLGVIGWRHVQQIAGQMSRKEKLGIAKRWAEGVQCFLEHEHYIPFIGFNWLMDNAYRSLDDESKIASSLFHVGNLNSSLPPMR